MSWAYILSQISQGIIVTLELTALGLTGGFILGFPLAVARTYGRRFSKWVAVGYIELIRGTPMLLQLYLIGFGLPLLLRQYFPNFVMNVFWAASLGMMINSGAYQAEYIRGAFKSIDVGQAEAGIVLGMSKWQIITRIIFPQAFRIMLPSWTNEIIYLLKYSSLAMLLAVPEMMYQAKLVAAATFMYAQVYLVIAVLYLGFSIIITQIMRTVEKKIYIPGVTTVKRGAL
ncbi:amine acid ABC transporter, permease protein, 3-TM region, His/Glu/Gln/Arg/opine family [Aciduliprofundum sp. MAR08-339]|uniref:amino acid ABC transporter permease n=1 Tax=Aciduliprofundum sp. (strain MAR08-339) TaxID=673860 RepID=UPI0002A48623|nr:amine acid ABC transporter, permease protein, 3-TM region, His/Glu/Gln/Arg/opine family [Aciduliprofundum sp. MAR08-339]